MKLRLFGIVLVSFFATTVVAKSYTRQQYIDRYKEIAIKEMKRTGVPASITLAQGILESGNGNSTLALQANNHFGIKCHKDWRGRKFYHDDDQPNECFRVYATPELSFKDHSDFLVKHSRYDFLFDLKTTDYKGWAKGLKQAGYATASKYDHSLIRIIEEEKLYRFDEKGYRPEQDLYEPATPLLAGNVDNFSITPFGGEVKTENRIEYTVVRKNDTYESIAEDHGVMVWQLLKYNERTKGYALKAGEPLYLQPKRNKADIMYKTHTVKAGESMYAISQRYGIKIKALYKRNNMEVGQEPTAGTELSLRKKVKA